MTDEDPRHGDLAPWTFRIRSGTSPFRRATLQLCVERERVESGVSDAVLLQEGAGAVLVDGEG